MEPPRLRGHGLPLDVHSDGIGEYDKMYVINSDLRPTIRDHPDREAK